LGPALAAHWVERVLWLVWFHVFQFIGVDPILARPTTPEYQQPARYFRFGFSVAWQSVNGSFRCSLSHIRSLGFSNNLKIKNCPVCIITTFCPYSLVNAFVITPSTLTGTGNAIFSNSRNGSPSGWWPSHLSTFHLTRQTLCGHNLSAAPCAPAWLFFRCDAVFVFLSVLDTAPVNGC
jgi:hypothetical protein